MARGRPKGGRCVNDRDTLGSLVSFTKMRVLCTEKKKEKKIVN